MLKRRKLVYSTNLVADEKIVHEDFSFDFSILRCRPINPFVDITKKSVSRKTDWRKYLSHLAKWLRSSQMTYLFSETSFLIGCSVLGHFWRHQELKSDSLNLSPVY